MTSDPIARALAQVEREAREAGWRAMDTGYGWCSHDDTLRMATERDVWKAAYERALRTIDATKSALIEAALPLEVLAADRENRRWLASELQEQIATALPLLREAVRQTAACFPPEREEERT